MVFAASLTITGKPSALVLLVLLALAMTVSVDSVYADQVDVWFGTSTPRNGLSKGIYHAKLDTDKGSLTTPCLLYTSPSPRDLSTSRMPSSA